MPDDVQLSMEPIGEAQLGSSPRGGVPPWVAVVSIVIGVLGLLCWGGMRHNVSSRKVSWLRRPRACLNLRPGIRCLKRRAI